MWRAWAFFRRDLLTDLSYKLSFALEGAHLLVGIAGYYFLARLLDEQTPEGYAPFAFIAVGVAVNGYMTTSLVCFAQAIRGGQTMGTLKAVLTTKTSPTEFIISSSVYPFARSAVDAAVCLLAASAFGLTLGNVNLFATALLLAFSFLGFCSVGILSAASTLVFKRGDPLLWLFVSTSWLLGGVLYPREMLPQALQSVAQLLPLTHALDGMRLALLHGAPTADVLPQIRALILFSAIGLPGSLAAFHLGVRQARVAGTLAHV